MIQWGNTGAVQVSANSVTVKSIVFGDATNPNNIPFGDAYYIVFLTMNTNQTDRAYEQCFISYYARSTIGFTIRFFNGISSQKTFNVDWCAMST